MPKQKLTRRSGIGRSKRARATAAPSLSPRPFPIVGIGASAGGLEAMTQLLKLLPARTGMAFVLVQHLDPTHESALTSLLSRLTAMPVSEAKHNVPLRPDHLYVIPPNKLLGIADRRLKLSPRSKADPSRLSAAKADAHLPIDEFFRALAGEEGSRAVGVVLSGNGADGTQGLLAIKAAGGLTFAQEEKSAKYPAMPGSAITAGCVDFVLAPDRLARELARVAGHPYVAPGASDEEIEPEVPAPDRTFDEILMLLRQRMGVDFTHYKHATLQRRMQRRMVLHKLETLKEYARRLRSHPNEVKELFSDILIHVTGFFRDASVFQVLKKKLFPRLLKHKPADDPIRIWVPGCSTGEEVYSIAIALVEFLGDCKRRHPVQIFGTDIHDAALEKARAGVFPDNIKHDVSSDRRRRFFLKTESGYRVNKSVRELCIFARQNVAVDPPFSNLDLISCRNLLIYLGQPLQRKVLPLFHYALRPAGFLMLGASETIGSFCDLFSLTDKKAKIYVKKTTHIRHALPFDATGSELPPADKQPPAPAEPGEPSLADVQKQADRILLSHYSPAGVVINRELEVLQFRGHTGLFLEHPHGEASLDLLKMARENLTLDLRAALSKALKQNLRVRQAGLRVRQNGGSVDLAVEIIPYTVPPSAEQYFLVLFQPETTVAAPVEKKARGRKAVGRQTVESGELAPLRKELAATRESLQAIIEEQEATNEELRSANEEITSSNEELQSTNEELETAKEELQSTNEELTTLNDELESRNTELEHVNDNLYNVLGSVNIPILILGADLRIRRFTGMAEKLFNLIPGDVGRPITDIALPLDVPDLPQLVLEVIDRLTVKELEVKDRRGHWWSVRVRPYKTTDQKIDGAVVALVDIDVIKGSAEQMRQSRAFADAMINAMRRPVLLLDPDLSVQAANQPFYTAFHVHPEDTLNRRIYSLGSGQWDIPKLRTLLEEILPQNSVFADFEVEHNFPDLGRRTMKLGARRLAVRGDQQHLILLTIEDVTKKE